MTFGEIEDLARYEISDETGVEAGDSRVKPYQMLAYANEAETEACIRARLIVDSSTSEICEIEIVPGVVVYPYDPRILLILRGEINGAINPLGRVSYTVMDEKIPGWKNHTGEVTTFVTGMDSGKLRIYRKSIASSVLNLTAIRTPLQPMKKREDSPEIISRLHPSLILWMKHKVYNNQDSELFDRNRADVHLAAFEQKFGKRTADPYDVFDSMQITQYASDIDYCDDYL